MKLAGHLSGGFIVTQSIVSRMNIHNNQERIGFLLLGSLAGILPDLDIVWYVIKKKGVKYDSDFRHHTWITHTFPFYWLPSALILLYGKMCHNEVAKRASLVVAAGTTTHLLQDTVGSGDGIMLFYPFTRKMFGVGLIGKHGREWQEAYERSSIYWVERSLIIIGVLLFIKDLLKGKKADTLL